MRTALSTLALSLILLAVPQLGSAEIAASAAEVRPILPGVSIPQATVRDRDGNPTDLAAAIGGQPAVVVFYRGGWCPFCNLQLADLRLIHDDLKALGYRLIAVSPDRPEKLNETLGSTELDYTLISDSDAAAMKAFGIAFQVDADTLNRYRDAGLDLAEAAGNDRGLLPVPGVFIFDGEGVLQFAYVHPDYRVRVPGGVILAAAMAIAENRHRLQPGR